MRLRVRDRRAYRGQEGQDVDLPDATALQVGDRGLFLGLIVWRHGGLIGREGLLIVVRRDRKKADQKDLRSAAFLEGAVVNAQRSQEKLAGDGASLWGKSLRLAWRT
jgi:hypothetical protein